MGGLGFMGLGFASVGRSFGFTRFRGLGLRVCGPAQRNKWRLTVFFWVKGGSMFVCRKVFLEHTLS